MRRQRGFTIVELLVTMAIAVIGLLAIMSMFVVTSRANASGAASGEGVAVASATIEDMRAMTLDDLSATYGPMPIDVALDTVAGRAGTTFTRRVQVSELTATSTNLIKIRIEVGWTDAGAAPGADGGLHDHRVSFELIRTASEAL